MSSFHHKDDNNIDYSFAHLKYWDNTFLVGTNLKWQNVIMIMHLFSKFRKRIPKGHCGIYSKTALDIVLILPQAL